MRFCAWMDVHLKTRLSMELLVISANGRVKARGWLLAASSDSILARSYSEWPIAVVGASHARRPIHATRFVLLFKHQTAPNDHWRFNRHNVRL
ncbi:hypothetical protein EMIT0324P_11792 [Pseudomonas chlororaphis]